MKRISLFAAVLITTALLFSAGCGGSDKNYTTNASASTGQQLIDLQKARDSGAISEKEYESMRKALIKKND